jgi:hypothetical protein
MLLNETNDTGIEVAQGHPTIGMGNAEIHISEELLPIRVIPPFLLKLIQDGFDFLFA